MSLTQDLRWSLGRSIALQLQRQTDLLLCTINCFLQWDHLPNMAVGDLAFYYTLYLCHIIEVGMGDIGKISTISLKTRDISIFYSDFFSFSSDIGDICITFYVTWCSIKGVLHPSTKISMFCLFSPSSRGKLILFMYGCDRCVWFKVKKHYIFSQGFTNPSCGTVQNIFFPFQPKKSL